MLTSISKIKEDHFNANLGGAGLYFDLPPILFPQQRWKNIRECKVLSAVLRLEKLFSL